MILRSRCVLPIVQPPIQDGAVRIEGERIIEVGRWSDVRRNGGAPVFDLGEAILLPGLINAHCHLDYTGMAGSLPPRRSFSDWIKSIVTLKNSWSDDQFRASWVEGAKMLERTGTTTVVDAEAMPHLLPEVLGRTELRVVSCHELISIKRQPEQLLQEASSTVRGWPNEMKGLSPHAPYTTNADLLKRARDCAKQNGWLHTTHVAESQEEFDMFAQGRGAMAEWLGFQRDMSDCGRTTPVQHVAAAGALEGMLVVHANYINAEDVSRLAQHGASVVHCPRSHAYFEHALFPFRELQSAGVNVCLGTDSLATVRRQGAESFVLSLFPEMRAFSERFSSIAPRDIVPLVTSNAAKAIARIDLGRITAGAVADLCVVPQSVNSDPWETVVQHDGPVRASMIRGQWLVRPEDMGGSLR